METKKNNKFGDLVRWASELGAKHDVTTPTVLTQFRRLKNAGADIEKAKREIEDLYTN